MKVLHLPALLPSGRIRHHFYLADGAAGGLLAFVDADGALARDVCAIGVTSLSCDPNTPERLAVAMAAFAQIYPNDSVPPPERWLPGGLVVETVAPPGALEEFTRIAAERRRVDEAEKALRATLESASWVEVIR